MNLILWTANTEDILLFDVDVLLKAHILACVMWIFYSIYFKNFFTKTEKLGKKIHGLSKMKISFLHDKLEGEKDYTGDQEAF